MLFRTNKPTTLPSRHSPTIRRAKNKNAGGTDACSATLIDLVNTTYRKLSRAFPDVEGVSAQELNRLQQQGGPSLLLLDVRRPEEVATSTLPGPVVNLAEFEAAGGAEAFRGRDVVAYCTIGYRSGKVAQRLQKKGLRVRNLEGSIAAHLAHGYGLVSGEDRRTPTRRVHMFSSAWAQRYTPPGFECVTYSPVLAAWWSIVEAVKLLIAR